MVLGGSLRHRNVYEDKQVDALSSHATLLVQMHSSILLSLFLGALVPVLAQSESG